MNLASTVYAPPRAKKPWRVQELYAPAAARLYSHGRHALAEALRLAGVHGRRVLLPSFICRDLLASVAAAGAQPVYYGVGPDLKPEEDHTRWPDAAAVLAVDYFGFPQDLAPFEAYARRSGAMLIEDAAHALFSRDASGRLLGTRAPLGILSLRKSLTLPNGGALLASDPELAKRLPAQLVPAAPAGPRAALKAAARPFLGLAGARATHKALTTFRRLRGDASGHVPPDPTSERELPGPAEPCAQLGFLIAVADPEIEVSRRRALGDFCRSLARREVMSPVFAELPDGVAPYGFAFRAPDFDKARSVFAAEGLTALPWPDLPADLIGSAPPHHRDVGLVHFLW